MGLPLGILLDGFRFLRMLWPHRGIAVFLEDMCFSATAMLLLQCYATMFARGELRLYYALGALLGLILYLMTIGAVWSRMLQRCKGAVQRACSRICCVLCRNWQKIRLKFVANPKKQRKHGKMQKNT